VNAKPKVPRLILLTGKCKRQVERELAMASVMAMRSNKGIKEK
jgi:hypothetical protein